MNQPIAMNTTRKHVVWLDVVRLVAMFTIVCCHSADPFNFYPGEPPANIDEIKFWGARLRSLSPSVCPTVCHDYRSIAAPRTWRNIRFLQKKNQPCILAVPYLECHL